MEPKVQLISITYIVKSPDIYKKLDSERNLVVNIFEAQKANWKKIYTLFRMSVILFLREISTSKNAENPMGHSSMAANVQD